MVHRAASFTLNYDPIRLRAEERFALALQDAVRKRTSDAQMDSVLAEPKDMAQPMSMTDRNLQSFVFWHTVCIS